MVTKSTVIRQILKSFEGYEPEKKKRFHSVAKSLLRGLARAMSLASGTFDLRTNLAGPGVIGETTLHTDTMYVQICGTDANYGNVLFRACKGRKDYTGMRNNWAQIEALDDPVTFARRLANVNPNIQW